MGSSKSCHKLGAGGHTVAVLTLTDADVRYLAPGEILHARPLGPP